MVLHGRNGSRPGPALSAGPARGEGVETAVSEEVILQLSESEGEGNGKGGRQSETAPEGTEEEGIV